MSDANRIELPIITPEEQYQAAGWIAAFNVLGDIADKYKRQDDTLSTEKAHWVGGLFLRYGTVHNNNVVRLVPLIERYRDKVHSEGSNKFHSDLEVSRMILSGGKIDPDLQAAHVLYYENDSVARALRQETDFTRLEQHISQCHDYNLRIVDAYYEREQVEPELKHKFAFALKRIQADSAFYIGKYDADEQSNSSV